MTLEQIAAKHPTDKLSVHSYLPIYERLFAPLKTCVHPVLEIGVDGAGSLAIWSEFFATAEIWGFDINPRPSYMDRVARSRHFQLDAYTKGREVAELRGEFTAIIDDGPHSIESQRDFCRMYPPLLCPDGVAVVEDIQDINQAPSLVASLPPGFESAIIDLRHIKGRYDDVMLAIWRKA